jgi:hypothetical protein
VKVLIACEESATVREAFRSRGHDAMSCDLIPSAKPGPHHCGDVRELRGEKWDLIIAHPPCTYLANSGARWLYNPDGSKNARRWANLLHAVEFFNLFLDELFGFSCEKAATENPIMHKHARERILRPYSQIIHPWQFGHGESKATCLWLKGLPELKPTNIVAGREQRIWKLPPSANRQQLRSVTYSGIAEAMAEQWGASSCL